MSLWNNFQKGHIEEEKAQLVFLMLTEIVTAAIGLSRHRSTNAWAKHWVGAYKENNQAGNLSVIRHR